MRWLHGLMAQTFLFRAFYFGLIFYFGLMAQPFLFWALIKARPWYGLQLKRGYFGL